MPVCSVCREGFEGIWDPSKTKRVCTINEWKEFADLSSWDVREDCFEDERYKFPEFIYGHHATHASFMKAVDERCVVCRSTAENLRQVKDQEINPKVSTLGYYTFFKFSWIEWMSHIIVHIYIDGTWEIVFMKPHNFSETILTPTLISPFTGDGETWGTIQGWLNRCLEAHTLCNRRDTAYKPSRLVKLCTAAEPTFCIVDRDMVQLNSQYLALSYCWGTNAGKLPLKLTWSTLERFSKEQPCYILPKTFRDATEVARRLGICYLWIDSLCILQDSEEDWARESSSMREVYGNAFLTIAALGAQHSDDGLFFSRDPTKLNPAILYLGIDNAENIQPFEFRDEFFEWRDSFNKEPLLKRGWVVQERVLSKRVLYFGSEQVFWECYETACCETHRDTLEYPENTSIIEVPYIWKALTGSKRRSYIQKSDIQRLFEDWYHLLRIYTICDLTYPKDKLVAVSGIVKYMRQHLTRLGCESPKYLAGIWQQELPQALLWFPTRNNDRRSKLYRAPSWSWSSMDGEIEPVVTLVSSKESLWILASVIDAWVTPVNREDETGEVSDGIITLVGALIIANFSPLRENGGLIIKRDIADFRDHRDDTLLFETKAMCREDTASVTLDLFDDDVNQVLCLPITQDGNKQKIDGLALTRVGDRKYRRVGTFCVRDGTGDFYRSFFTYSNHAYVDII
ncbi:HET-domain-containing protein [Annulohypoxylon nitens]|nr:HET-domain-containing protein [Annulohypoxylon nitens]